MRLHPARAIQRLIRRLDWRHVRSGAVAPLEATRSRAVVRLPASHLEAARDLVDVAAVNSSDYRGRQFFASTSGVHPDLLRFRARFRAMLEERGIPMYAFEFVRSRERQRALYEIGRTKAKPGGSPHQWGCAVDIVHLTRLWDLTEKEWSVIGQLGREAARKLSVAVVWGGDWKFYDPAHWELRDWREYRAARLSIEARGEELPEASELLFACLDAERVRLRVQGGKP